MKFACRIIGIGLILIVLSGCSVPNMQRKPTPVRPSATPILPTLSPAAAKMHNNLEQMVGGTAGTIIMTYGKAPVDIMDSRYRPPIIRIMQYPEIGLEFSLNKDRIYGIEAIKPFTGKVFDLKIGDNISHAVEIYGTYETDGKIYKNTDLGLKVFYVTWLTKLPLWSLAVTEKGVIVRISFHDQALFGNWIG